MCSFASKRSASNVTRSVRYDIDVKSSVQAVFGDGSGGGAKEIKPSSTIGAPRQPPDDLPSVGELFTAMDVPAFMTNDDVTPYVLPCMPQI